MRLSVQKDGDRYRGTITRENGGKILTDRFPKYKKQSQAITSLEKEVLGEIRTALEKGQAVEIIPHSIVRSSGTGGKSSE